MQPLPFAVIAQRAWTDERGRMTLDQISDSLTVDGFPSVIVEFHLAAVFELAAHDFSNDRPLLVRLIGPDGEEVDVWRVSGHEIPNIGRPRAYYRILLRYSNVPVSAPGTYEIRIKYDDVAEDLCVPFDLRGVS